MCPKCGSALNRVKITKRPEYGGTTLKDAEVTGRFELDQCLACNGVWFDANELDQYLAEKLVLLDSPKVSNAHSLDRKTGNCPNCGKLMQQDVIDKYKGVVVDICSACKGIWLDSTEIDKLEGRSITLIEKWTFFFNNLKDRMNQRRTKGK